MEKKHKELLEKWSLERPDYSDNNNIEFTYDGPANWEKWLVQKPKILFLMKEAHSGYHPCKHQEGINEKFILNITRWKFAIKGIYENPNDNITLPSDEDLRKWTDNKTDDIAIVEVKKKDDGSKSTAYSTIMKFAEQDKLYLKGQIDLINPDVILCGYTCDAYADHIYREDQWEELYKIESPKKCSLFKHKNRLVIDFYHPSPRYGHEVLFDLLFRLLTESKAFEKFDWGKKN